MLEKVKEGSVYRNKKTGTLYQVMCLALCYETLQSLVVYHADNGPVYVRPIELFKEKFEDLSP